LLVGAVNSEDGASIRSESTTMKISKYSMGIGDRFGLEGEAQLRAFQTAKQRGVTITPVWNKSNREHSLIGTHPEDVRAEADAAVKALHWTEPYFVDADHIGLGTVDKFLAAGDFFTIDVADAIGKSASDASLTRYVAEMQPYSGMLRIPGLAEPLAVSAAALKEIAAKYLFAVEEAGRVYRHIAERKGEGNFVTEVSFDEANTPQTPAELFFILAAAAREKIPLATVAPKFTGEFLKGIDYVGDIKRFAREFEEDLAVLAFARRTFGLPAGLKLSIHSGSDKFSLYPIMHRALTAAGAGIHLKTAGTTWLEEVIGLAASGGEGLAFVKALYREACARYDEMAKPYATVIAIDRQALPTPAAVDAFTSQEYVETLEHNQACKRFNIHFRQMVHISFRVAAEKQAQYLPLLKANRSRIETCVSTNILKRHIAPLFLGTAV
jgi:tagaturonate epimerase